MGQEQVSQQSTEDDSQKSQDSRNLLLKAGAAARMKLYQSFLMKMRSGETLSRSELKSFLELEKEIEGSGEREESRVNGFGDAATYCGVSERTISYHIKRGNILQNADGSFNRDVLDAWLAKYGRRKQDKDIARKRLLADLRFRVARAEKEETLVAQLKGELFRKDEIAQGWGFRVSEITAALQSLVDRLPPLLVDKERAEIRQIIEDEIYEIRMRFSRDGRFTPAATV